MATTTVTIYKVTASFERDGQIIGCDQWEVLGDAYRARYTMREEAEAEASCLQDDINNGSVDLDPSTTYSVAEETCSVTVLGVEQGEEGIEIEAIVDGHATLWYAEPDNVGGLTTTGPTLDAWVDRDIARLHGDDAARIIGAEIVASASEHYARHGAEAGA